MIIGFTGTRYGMSSIQMKMFCVAIGHVSDSKDFTFHHGACVGSDEEAHEIIYNTYPKCKIVIHPPIEDMHRATFEESDRVMMLEGKTFLERNHDIVNACDVLIATPINKTGETKRSGTWATVRYARKQKKPIAIIRSNGMFSIEGGKI